jgi:hypothetical protein
VEYLLRAGADPTLAGCPAVDDVGFGMIASADDGDDGLGPPPPLEDRPDLHMDAFDAAGKLNRKIRRCRRTQDLLMAVKVGRRGSCTRRIDSVFVRSLVRSLVRSFENVTSLPCNLTASTLPSLFGKRPFIREVLPPGTNAPISPTRR